MVGIGTARGMAVEPEFSEPDFSVHPATDAAREAAEALFERTAERLLGLLPVAADIRHVGATSVPGCLTKGDLDIVVRVSAADFAVADSLLAAHFARNTGSTRDDTFSAFEDGASEPHLGIQLTVVDGPSDVFHAFADRLRADPDLLARYNELKTRYDGRPMRAYRAAKDAFISQVLDGSSSEECS
jgi:GrpB-like predicted nucleotidyltransferase (UPF0157 family)